MPIGTPAQRYRCTVCKDFKRISSFPKCKRTVTGVKTTCTMCQRAIFSKWYHSNGGKKQLHLRRNATYKRRRKGHEKAMLENAERMKMGIRELLMYIPGIRSQSLGTGYADIRRKTAKFMKERTNDPFWDQFLED